MVTVKALTTNVLSKGKSAVGVVSEFVRTNPVISGGAIALGGSALVTGLVISGKSKAKRKKSSKKTTKKRKKACPKKRKSSKKGRSTPRTAGKGKDTSTRRIRYTKNRQPYVILRSGKARFIKKSSAKRSHKLKGGRY